MNSKPLSHKNESCEVEQGQTGDKRDRDETNQARKQASNHKQ